MPLTFGSLFAGIGGFDLGFERAGMVCKWQVEINEFCRAVLAKHWPNVARHDDVRTFPPQETRPEEWAVDVICGGFPCQDISSSGKKGGIEGNRSGLWAEYARIIRVLRPRYVVVENVADIFRRGFHRVAGDLAGMGFDASWALLPAASFGAPQRRLRAFVVAHSHGGGQQGREERYGYWSDACGRSYLDGLALAERTAASAAARVRRMGGRVPRGVDRPRIAACGNAVVPAVAEYVGRRIVALDSTMKVCADEVA